MLHNQQCAPSFSPKPISTSAVGGVPENKGENKGETKGENKGENGDLTSRGVGALSHMKIVALS